MKRAGEAGSQPRAQGGGAVRPPESGAKRLHQGGAQAVQQAAAGTAGAGHVSNSNANSAPLLGAMGEAQSNAIEMCGRGRFLPPYWRAQPARLDWKSNHLTSELNFLDL